MTLSNFSDTASIQYGQEIEIEDSRRTGRKLKVTWLGLIHEDEGCGVKAKFFAYKRGKSLGIAYFDDEQLTIMDTEVFAGDMGIPKEKVKKLAKLSGNLKYDHLIWG